MNSTKTKLVVGVTLISLFASSLTYGASVELNNGTVLNGEVEFLEGGALIVHSNGIPVTVNLEHVKAVEMGSSPTGNLSSASPNAMKQTPSSDTQKASAPTVLSQGTTLTIRTQESLNSRSSQQGHRFTAQLEQDLLAEGVVVAERGSNVYGRLTEVSAAGRLAGSATLALELTHIMINNQMLPISTRSLSTEGSNSAGTSAGRTARTAAIGGLANGSDGARTGAKVGLGASLLTKGNDIEVPSGTLIDFTLTTPLIIQ